MAKYLIETITLDASASSITFSSIPQTYTDLMITISARYNFSDTFAKPPILQFNSVTSGYSGITLVAANALSPNSISLSTATSNSITGARVGDGFIPTSGATGNTFSNASLYISNYTSSVAKSYSVDGVGETNGTSPLGLEITAGISTDISPIADITLVALNNGDFTSESTFSLYGFLAGNDGSTTVS